MTKIDIPTPDRVIDSSFNSDGSLLAFLYFDGQVLVYEADENRTFSKICETEPCCMRATSISFSSSEFGFIFAISDSNGKTYVYQRIKLNEFKQVVTFQQHNCPINQIEFHPNRLCFAACSADGYVSLTSCDMKSWTIQTLKISDKQITSLSWSPPSYMSFIDAPNGCIDSLLTAASADGYLFVLEIINNNFSLKMEPLAAHNGAINDVAWRPLPGFKRYEIATCGADMNVKIWTYENQKWSSFTVCSCPEEPVAVKWSSCGFLLSVSYGSNTTKIWREISYQNWKMINE